MRYDGLLGEMLCPVYLNSTKNNTFFFTEHKSHLSSVLIDFDWLLGLPYFSNIFERLNIWNLSMQGSVSNISYVGSNTNAMLKTLTLLEKQIENKTASRLKDYIHFCKKMRKKILISLNSKLK